MSLSAWRGRFATHDSPRGELTRRNLPRGKLGRPHCLNSPRGELALRTLVIAIACILSSTSFVAHGQAQPEAVNGPYVLDGEGYVLDSSHPMRPGDARRLPISFVLSAYPAADEFVLALRDSGDSSSRPDLWVVRQGRASRADTAGVETPDSGIGDVSDQALAALLPEFADIRRRGRAGRQGDAAARSAWSPIKDRAGEVIGLRRAGFDERLGDDQEEVRYFPPGERQGEFLSGVTITRRGREVGAFRFLGLLDTDPRPVPVANGSRIDVENRNLIHQLAPGQVTFREIVPHVFLVDLDSLNTRVTVAEFTDSLAVLEGAYGSAVCDVLAREVQRRFHKPVRLFAFSHLHGQYSGGTRSWVHEGATVVVPPTTEPLVHQMVEASFRSHPDALAREPKPVRVLTVPQHLHLEDATNALDVYNVPSGHTDEYLLFHFPRQRVLLTGDLMFLRPGKPFAGRSRQLAQTVAKLGLGVDTYVATWPLHGYGTRSVVTAQEFAQAAEGAAK